MFFEDLGKKITKVGENAVNITKNVADSAVQKTKSVADNAVQKTKNAADSARIHGQISDEEKNIRRLYLSLGEQYYKAHKADNECEFSFIVSEINEAEKRISDYSEQLRGLKESRSEGNFGTETPLIRCPNCGKQMPADTKFCGECGSKIEKAEDK